MATGKTIPSGFCSDGLGDEELQDERMILPKTTNKMIWAIFNKNFPRRFMPLGYSDYSRFQDYIRCSIPPCKSRRKVSKGELTQFKWAGVTVSPLLGSLSPIQHSRWLGKSSGNGKGMKSPPDGSIQNKRQRIFALDGSEEDSKFPFVSTI